MAMWWRMQRGWHRGVLCIVGLTGLVPSALAACESKVFSARAGSLYLEAETFLFTEENPEAALESLLRLKELKLNCYEFKNAVRLTAAVYFRLEQYLDAARSLEEAISNDLLEGDDLLRTYYQVAQIYLQEEDLQKAKNYLDRWLLAGAVPNVSQYMQLAALHNKLGDNVSAERFLESLLGIESSPSKDVIDFVIFIYNENGKKKKLADFLRGTVIPRFPGVKRYWEVAAGLYFEGGQERSAFETVKAMYLSGLLESEEEIMRVVNFYNRFNAPFAAGRILDEEIGLGRIRKTSERLELLANLYQVSREYERAIPVLRDLARLSGEGKAYERLGRSYFELQQYEEAVEALGEAAERGSIESEGQLYGLIGRAYHHQGERSEAREAFVRAGDFPDGRATSEAWLSFMDDEDATAFALEVYTIQVVRDELSNIRKSCDRVILLGSAGGKIPQECEGIKERLAGVEAELAALVASRPGHN